MLSKTRCFTGAVKILNVMLWHYFHCIDFFSLKDYIFPPIILETYFSVLNRVQKRWSGKINFIKWQMQCNMCSFFRVLIISILESPYLDKIRYSLNFYICVRRNLSACDGNPQIKMVWCGDWFFSHREEGRNKHPRHGAPNVSSEICFFFHRALLFSLSSIAQPKVAANVRCHSVISEYPGKWEKGHSPLRECLEFFPITPAYIPLNRK